LQLSGRRNPFWPPSRCRFSTGLACSRSWTSSSICCQKGAFSAALSPLSHYTLHTSKPTQMPAELTWMCRVFAAVITEGESKVVGLTASLMPRNTKATINTGILPLIHYQLHPLPVARFPPGSLAPIDGRVALICSRPRIGRHTWRHILYVYGPRSPTPPKLRFLFAVSSSFGSLNESNFRRSQHTAVFDGLLYVPRVRTVPSPDCL